MSRKSKHRIHHITVNKKSKTGRRRQYSDERELFREDYVVKKPCNPCPKQVNMKPREPQPNKYDEEQIKELVKLAGENQQLLNEMTLDARITKAKQKKTDSIVKTFDIWGTPLPEKRTIDFTGKPIPVPTSFRHVSQALMNSRARDLAQLSCLKQLFHTTQPTCRSSRSLKSSQRNTFLKTR